MTEKNEKRRRRFGIGTIASGGAAVLAIIFIFQNTGSGTVQFLFWDLTLATWIWASLLFVIGGVFGYFLHWHRMRDRLSRRD